MLGEQVIKQVASNLANSKMQMATLCENVLDKAQYLDPNCVKVVFDIITVAAPLFLAFS
jgi:3-deoxy-manno-octulosonate cytidylyltransferase (CMP-KDO synthetase)